MGTRRHCEKFLKHLQDVVVALGQHLGFQVEVENGLRNRFANLVSQRYNRHAMDQTLSPIGVVVVSYNTAPLLRRCLASLQGCELPLRIVVVDNGSRDESVHARAL
ncbi:MAG: hypothetical protein KatS3mg055_2269 [Chloroflexus sp.]|uniref:glycosyltransferase family 2 protein n=1 Tax=Chloroflexus sp. TaxID=1904827 RepID=UPI0021DD3A99|nr:glycosyltransferase [Chloroflexus sp.]GIV89751.1 MAG: hypothetical protein KatS3mg055_2269 [Chloroflexus sp.]